MAPSRRTIDRVATATHGNNCAIGCDRQGPIATDRNSEAIACLAGAIDASPGGRKGAAIDAGMPESTLSKILAGVQGVPSKLLDTLDPSTLADFMTRLGADRGIEVRLRETSELSAHVREALLDLHRAVELLSARWEKRR